jgi:hypothetical protein
MTKENTNRQKPSPGSRIRDGLRGLLDRLKEEVQDLAGSLGPQPQPAYQPVPVQIPVRRRYR